MAFDLVDTVTDPPGRMVETPSPEPLAAATESPSDQAVFDAEFVAMMLVEFPDEEPATTSPTTPPGTTSASRCRPRPQEADISGTDDTMPLPMAPGLRRRTDARSRSPPR